MKCKPCINTTAYVHPSDIHAHTHTHAGTLYISGRVGEYSEVATIQELQFPFLPQEGIVMIKLLTKQWPLRLPLLLTAKVWQQFKIKLF